jgi:fucose 4-O-acetylase-like acetyltransferase
MSKPINIEMSLLKAFGIIAVVTSHRWVQFPYLFAPTMYHIGLFFFASGYFYSLRHEDRPFPYLRTRLVWLFSVFYVYHLYHALELHLMWQNGIEMGWAPPQFPQLLYYPFITFSSYGLGFAMWFVLQLFVTQIAYLAIRRILRSTGANEWGYLIFFFSFALFATALSVQGYNADAGLLLLFRTWFCLAFLHLGYFYRTMLEGKNLFTSRIALWVVLVQACLVAALRQLDYTVGTMEFHGHIFTPFLVAFAGIYICLYFAKALAKVVDENHILCRIGNNSFHISAMHMSFGFVLVLLVRYYYGVTAPIKDPLYSIETAHVWALYVVVGVLGPVFMIEGLRKLRAMLRRTLFAQAA